MCEGRSGARGWVRLGHGRGREWVGGMGNDEKLKGGVKGARAWAAEQA